MKDRIAIDHTSLARLIDYQFKDITLLTTSLTHRSRLENSSANAHGPNNERLEFLGDAVLSLVTANHLYRKFGSMNEGDLSRLRAQFVCQKNLYEAAKNLGLGDYILSDKAMRISGSTQAKAILADALEALIGAVFLDGGLAAAEEVIFRILGYPATEMVRNEKDAKTRLQEMVQASTKNAPKYVVLESHGPPHAPTFLVGVTVGETIVAKAEGESKKTAAQNAAILALDLLSKRN
ncbi:MAG TPA: ribonuclease III [Myxococcota bacterium]|nr:ribonuclease III [Myxococcota bacterium]